MKEIILNNPTMPLEKVYDTLYKSYLEKEQNYVKVRTLMKNIPKRDEFTLKLNEEVSHMTSSQDKN